MKNAERTICTSFLSPLFLRTVAKVNFVMICLPGYIARMYVCSMICLVLMQLVNIDKKVLKATVRWECSPNILLTFFLSFIAKEPCIFILSRNARLMICFIISVLALEI